MKKIFLVLIAAVTFFNAAQAQNDTMYVMKNGVATHTISIKTVDVDSVIFYKPSTVSSSTVTDYDGNIYNTITIGTQVWMAENLKTTHYSNGTAIPLVNTTSIWAALT